MPTRTRRQLLRSSLALAGPGLLAGSGGAPPWGQATAKVPQIGFLTSTSPVVEAARVESFRQGLGDLGCDEGGKIVIHWRSTEGRFKQLPDLAAELVRLGADVIGSGGATATAAAKGATATIPIVMCWENDSVGNRLVASLARPGGNVTGLTGISRELIRKRLELLREAVPSLSRVGVLWNPCNADRAGEFELAETAPCAWVSETALPTTAASTSCRLTGEAAITRSTSAVAVCCS